MKTIISIVPMYSKTPAVYAGHPAIANAESVVYPINGVLSTSLKKGEEVKVILLKAIDPNDGEHTADRNEEIFKKELNAINERIGAKITYESVAINFTETRKEQEKLLKGVVDRLEEGTEVYADITYGPKSMPIIVFYALGFAERFLNVEVKNIVYGKAYFDADGKAYGHELVDMTALYYLNAITNQIEVDDAEQARDLLDQFLS